MPYKHKKNGKTVWMAQVKIDGKKLRHQFTRKEDAKKWELDQKELAKLPPEPTIPTTSFLEWATLYLDHSVRYSPKTYSEKKSALKRLLKTVKPDADVQTFRKMDALNYLQKLFKKKSGYSVNKERKNMAAAWNFGIKFLEGFPAMNPFLAVPRFPEVRQNRYVPRRRTFERSSIRQRNKTESFLLPSCIRQQGVENSTSSSGAMWTLGESVFDLEPRRDKMALWNMNGSP